MQIIVICKDSTPFTAFGVAPDQSLTLPSLQNSGHGQAISDPPRPPRVKLLGLRQVLPIRVDGLRQRFGPHATPDGTVRRRLDARRAGPLYRRAENPSRRRNVRKPHLI